MARSSYVQSETAPLPPADPTEANPLPSDDGGEPDAMVRQLPWMAIAMAMHGLLLLVAAFIVSYRSVPKPLPKLESSVAPVEMPPPPEQEEPPPLTNTPDLIEDTVVTPNLITDDVPTEIISPNEPLDVISPSEAESPSPLTGPNSALGFGGGGGGGTPGGGGGGPPLRPSVRPQNPVPPARIDAALQWLADHQNPGGHWSATHFHNDSVRLRRASPAAITRNIDFRDDIAQMRGSGDHDTGQEAFNTGLTGLALLAFVTEGITHKSSTGTPFAETVRRALRAVMATQDPEGCFGARDDEEFVYSHAICTMALAELHEKTLSPPVKRASQRAVDFIVRCQNPGMGWRYGVQPRENDTSVTAWMVLALKSARVSGMNFDEKTVYAGADAWFDRAAGRDDTGYMRTGYDRPGGGNARFANAVQYDMNAAMDACAVMSKLFMGSAKTSSIPVRQQAQNLVTNPAAWYIGGKEENGPWKIDMYYWYYASLALFQLGDDYWKPWERELIQPVLLKYQRGFHPKDTAAYGPQVSNSVAWLKDGTENPDAGRWVLDEHGSWDPVDPWGSAGGRVYSTAINALTLQVYYRYRQLANTPDKAGTARH